jgi:hypothetical protein
MNQKQQKKMERAAAAAERRENKFIPGVGVPWKKRERAAFYSVSAQG